VRERGGLSGGSRGGLEHAHDGLPSVVALRSEADSDRAGELVLDLGVLCV
jgi:hypothetical protein